MAFIKGTEARERAGEMICALCRQMDEGDGSAGTQSRLERLLRLWSECDADPEARLFWAEKGETMPENCGAAVLEEETAVPEGVKVYPIYEAREAPAAAAYDRLPGGEMKEELFGTDGMLKKELRAVGLEALRAHRTAFILMAGGAGTRYTDSARQLKLALETGGLTEEQAEAVKCFESADMDLDECLNQGKLFAPMSAVLHRGPFEINMESVAEVLSLTHADVPVAVFVSDSTRQDVRALIEKNGGFGIKYLAVVDQDMAPFVREDSFELLENAQGTARGANGGGGIVYSLGHARPIDCEGRPLFDGSLIDWFRALNVERVMFSQTDDAKRSDVYLGLAAAAGAEGGMVLSAVGSDYPMAMSDGKPSFKLGSMWSDGKGALCCTEFAELKPEQVARLTEPDRGEGRAVANTAMYILDTGLISRVIESGMLGIHFQRRKKEPDASGEVRLVTKFEYFMPDLMGIASKLGARCRIALLRDTSRLEGPLRNLTVDALPAKDICKLALAQQARLYCDTALAKAAGLIVEEGALIEIGPFAELNVGKNAVVRKGAKLYVGGKDGAPARVTFRDGACVGGRLVLTESAVIE